MTTQRPVVVVGAGAAGVAAALASATSVPTILLDEGPARADGKALTAAGVDYRPDSQVWGLFDGPAIGVFDDARAYEIVAGAVVIATGGIDRVWPVPGWQLDGVITVSEIGEGELRYGVVGSGEHADEAVSVIESIGGTVVAVEQVDDVRIMGDKRAERLGGEAVDRVVLALGRKPDPSLALRARAACAFDRTALIAMPLLAEDGATSRAGVFVTGEAAGVAGIDAVRVHGERSGRAAAAVAHGAAQSMDLRAPELHASPPLPLPDDPATVICREQEVDLGTVRAAIDRGVHDVNDLRRRTRAGMGLRGALETLPVLAALLLAADPAIADERLIPRQRPPARPLPFRVVIGEEVAS